jgi:hypothetical protein
MRNKKNAYFCDTCLHYIVTIDVDEGVTPMFLACRYLGEPTDPRNTCKGQSHSMMYPDEPWPTHDPAGRPIPTTPTWEWYKPDRAEMKRLLKKARQGSTSAAGTVDHVDKGGLLLRPAQGAIFAV